MNPLVDAVHNSVIGAGQLIAVTIVAVAVVTFVLVLAIATFREVGSRRLWIL